MQHLLNDIMADLMVCEIEGWCKHEYIAQIKELIGGIDSHHKPTIFKQR
jgi:hypothetical protein